MSALRHLEPHGVNTLLGEEVEFQETLTALFRDCFRKYGYRPVLTPTFEYLDLFRETERVTGDDMVKLIARDGRVLVIRPDATVPVSRMTARLYGEIGHPLKFSYITSVFRWADPAKGERLETLQAGIEAYNQPEPDCDAEVLALGIGTLVEAGMTGIHVDIGHAGWLEGLQLSAGISSATGSGCWRLWSSAVRRPSGRCWRRRRWGRRRPAPFWRCRSCMAKCRTFWPPPPPGC